MAATRRRVRPKREDVRAKILAAAEVEFLKRGYALATVSSIADSAGFTKGALFSNFDSKADLFLSLVEGRFALVLNESVTGSSWDGSTGELNWRIDEISLLAHKLEELTRRDETWHVLISELATLSTHDPACADVYLRSRKLILAMIQDAVLRLIGAAGTEDSVDEFTEDFANHIMLVTNGLAVESKINPDYFTSQMRIRIFESLLRGHTRPKL